MFSRIRNKYRNGDMTLLEIMIVVTVAVLVLLVITVGVLGYLKVSDPDYKLKKAQEADRVCSVSCESSKHPKMCYNSCRQQQIEESKPSPVHIEYDHDFGIRRYNGYGGY